MTNEQILEKAIRKAIDGGWNVPEHKRDKRYKWPPTSIKVTEDYGDEGASGWWLDFPDERTWGIKLCDSYDFEDLIFNHDFAKALWGEEEMRTDYFGSMGTGFTLMLEWEARLQQMVIADDPIKYLGENLGDD